MRILFYIEIKWKFINRCLNVVLYMLWAPFVPEACLGPYQKANQWTGFYMVGTSVIKELNVIDLWWTFLQKSLATKSHKLLSLKLSSQMFDIVLKTYLVVVIGMLLSCPRFWENIEETLITCPDKQIFWKKFSKFPGKELRGSPLKICWQIL